MSLQVPIEVAYAEACKALGDAIVLQRLLQNALATSEAEVARLQAENPPQTPGV